MNRDEKKRKKRRRPGGREPRRTAILVLAVLVALAALGGGGYLLLSEYALLGGRIVARDAVALALPDGALPEAAAFGALRSLQTIDLRGREDVTRDYVAAVQAAAPAGCEVLWTVRLSDGVFSSDAETLTLPGCTAADVAMLDCFPRLKRVDATGSTAYAALCEAAQARDDVAFTYALVVGDAVLTNADTTLTATGVDDVTALLQALPFFPALREADLRDGSAPAAEMRALCEAFPEIRFRYTVWMGGRAFDSDAETLDLSGVTFDDAQAAIDALSCFPNLEAADLFDSGLSATDGQAVAAALPALAVRYAVPLCGATFASDATELDLRELQVDAAALDAGLGHFSGLTAVLLPDGALDDAALDALEAAYPDVLFQRQIEVLGHVDRHGAGRERDQDRGRGAGGGGAFAVAAAPKAGHVRLRADRRADGGARRRAPRGALCVDGEDRAPRSAHGRHRVFNGQPFQVHQPERQRRIQREGAHDQAAAGGRP